MSKTWDFHDGTAYNFAFAGSTIINGKAISIKGYDVTDKLRAHKDKLPWEIHE